MRWMIYYALHEFDKTNNSYYFEDLKVEDIKVHENQIDLLLDMMDLPTEEKEKILIWYKNHCWSPRFILEAHRPFSGVLEVIRWFQLQPGTFVGLNTGRPEELNHETVASLNKLGNKFKITFDEELIYMNPRGWEEGVEQTKISGIEYFRNKGFKIFAFVDNEPENLKAVSEIDQNSEILLVHADTIFESKRIKLPINCVKGNSYDITDLIPERELPSHIQFVWHGINDFTNLRQFLSSNITWCECDVRYDRRSKELLLRHDAYEDDFLKYDSDVLSLKKILACLSKTNKSIKIDLKTGGYETIDKVIELLEPFRIDQNRLWFNGNVKSIQQEGFRILSRTFPRSII